MRLKRDHRFITYAINICDKLITIKQRLETGTYIINSHKRSETKTKDHALKQKALKDIILETWTFEVHTETVQSHLQQSPKQEIRSEDEKSNLATVLRWTWEKKNVRYSLAKRIEGRKHLMLSICWCPMRGIWNPFLRFEKRHFAVI